MALPLPILEPGNRLIVAGRTGCGKTSLARYLIERRNVQHWVILNPKHTGGYKSLPDSVVLHKWDAHKFKRAIVKHRFVIINFHPRELSPDFMDAVLFWIHENFDNIGVLCDELYYLHKNGEAGDGLVGLLTRGRERKQSFLGLVQRPKRISLFCFSESDYIVMMSLNLIGDRQRMVEATGDKEFIQSLPKYRWLWYTVDADASQLWGPVPLR